MKIARLALASLMLISLAGCFVSASVGTHVPVKVEGAKHCPPGQAKKGNC